ncbi:MAG: 2-amino-4-hydroxy-6-hydroxymethyldihydropteridine diphosphokinase [Selenomonadaceae bacterium]|nr:2-amino-4-hydroxy-6-hydroxymethyldihydropteridine diphosphokinase [Selenomonadaceae bacterium]
MEWECYVSLGANLGDRERALRQALERLHGSDGMELCRVSGFFETAPWGKPDQPPFVNVAAKLRTEMEPLELLETCQRIEKEMGRVRHEHWGARTMDIDLLHIPDVSMDTEQLHLPHPHMMERAFVLVPLAEIASGLEIAGKTVKEHLMACRDTGEVTSCPGSPMDFSLKLIACVDEREGLGKEGQLLFRLPEDMAFFRQQTWGGTVIMGRRTMESLGNPLDGRRNIALSRQGMQREGFTACRSLEELWQILFQSPDENTYVIGGGEIYRQLLPYCREAFVTRVAADGGADVFLPGMDEFSLRDCRQSVDAATGHEMSFCHYIRGGSGDGDFQE